LGRTGGGLLPVAFFQSNNFSIKQFAAAMDAWRQCAWFKCRRRFEPSRRTNQHRRAGGQRHEGALYCSRPCRQKAYRLRHGTGLASVTRTPLGTYTHATVTREKRHKKIQRVVGVKNGHARLQNRPLQTRHGVIVPDAQWPGMYRIKWRDGRLSDMANYTRAADALNYTPTTI
jgi:hypothetical protein